MKIFRRFLLVWAVGAVVLGSVLVGAAEINYAEIENYDFGKSRQALAVLEETLRDAAPAELLEIETRLLQLLDSPRMTFGGKQFICRVLRQFGTPRSVPKLAALLQDKELSHMARYALQHLPAPEAGEALRQALPKAQGDLRIGLIGSLGQRREEKAVPDIAPWITSGDLTLAEAAITALGRIGNGPAARALSQAKVAAPARPARDDAYLMCADRLLATGNTAQAAAIYREMSSPENSPFIRIAAYRGLVLAEKEQSVPTVLALLKETDPDLQAAAGTFITEMPGAKATQAFANQLPALPPEAQVVLLGALENRGDKAAGTAVAQLVDSGSEAVRLAAIQALAILGDASAVPGLAKASTQEGPTGKTALDSLSRLNGPGVTDALVQLIQGGATAPLRGNAIQVVVNRQETTAVPALLASARDADRTVRREAARALGVLAGQANLSALVSLLVSSSDSADRTSLQEAIIAVVSRAQVTDPAPILSRLAASEDDAQANLVAILPAIGGAAALQAVQDQLNHANPEVKRAAIRALSDWPDPSPLPDLLQVAKNDGDSVNRILSIRGYIKLLAIPANRSAEETVKLLAKAMESAPRTEERKAVLSALPNYPCEAALAMVQEAEKDSALAAEAQLASRKIKELMANKKLSAQASINNRDVQNALDGNRATRWATGRGMQPGDWFMIDLAVESTVTGLTLDAASSTGDYPRGYEVYVSFDGGSWGKPVIVGSSDTALTTIQFPKPVRARFIKIVQTGSVPTLFWSIHTLKVHFD